MENFKNLDRLPDEARAKLLPYLKNLLAVHQDNVQSVIIYGSAAGAHYVPKKSDINLLVVVKAIDFSVLQKSLAVVTAGLRQKITAPLFLTQEYIKKSLDVFPIEFLDMQDNHVVVFGEDVFSGLVIPEEYCRFFCEQQVKGKLIRVRQAYLEVGLNPERLRALLRDSLKALLPIFRNLIRFDGQSATVSKEEILKRMAGIYHLDAAIFLSILHHQTKNQNIPTQDLTIVAEKYINQLTKLAEQINA